ncbi:DUF6165 family protein [Chelatococcus reniformis]|uniref:DUF6165 family protein n=1 Tax=Chelatococcus reniformis TaxID=1494448 RepID=UPI00166CF9E2|nr:DUF6165 family protein [Chelatococcus reniformis]
MSGRSDELLVPVSYGELLDKITILEIKAERISDRAKLENVKRELAALSASRDALLGNGITEIANLVVRLRGVNEKLWQIEDDIRQCERNGDFGPNFISLARSVYFENDERARLKRNINLALGSHHVEEKSYSDYGSPSTLEK